MGRVEMRGREVGEREMEGSKVENIEVEDREIGSVEAEGSETREERGTVYFIRIKYKRCLFLIRCNIYIHIRGQKYKKKDNIKYNGGLIVVDTYVVLSICTILYA